MEDTKVDSDANKVTIIGKVEPSKLRERLAEKTKKKVDLISPQPSKKDTNNNDNKKKADENNTDKPDEKKPKEKEVFLYLLVWSPLNVRPFASVMLNLCNCE